MNIPKFSERIGVEKPHRILQVDSMSVPLRNSLWNLFYTLYERPIDDFWEGVAHYIAINFLKVPADELPIHGFQLRDWIKKYFFAFLWYEAYNMVEFIVQRHEHMILVKYKYKHEISNHDLANLLNEILERELSGFRFVEGTLAPISDPVEVSQIEKAVKDSKRIGLHGAHEHIQAAIRLIGKKPNADYRNVIKESISAVESVTKQISGSNSSGLDGALKVLSSKIYLHGSLQEGFRKLYGFTSDSDGIRHAIMNEPSVDFADAKYMLVSCSAFVNFLIIKAEQAGVLRK